MKNKRGVTGAEIMFLSMALGMSISAYCLKDSFRARKANEFCVAEGVHTSDQCKAIVTQMSKDQILDYIRDDDVPPQIDNYGYVSHQ